MSRSNDPGELGRRVLGARLDGELIPAQVVDAPALEGRVAVARGEVVGALSAPEAPGKAG